MDSHELPPNVTPIDKHRQRRNQENAEIEASHERTPANDAAFATRYLERLTHPVTTAQKGGLVGKIITDLNEPEVKPARTSLNDHTARRHLIGIMEDPTYDPPVETPDAFVTPISRSASIGQDLAFQVVDRLYHVAKLAINEPNSEPIPPHHMTNIIEIILRSDFDGPPPPSA